MVASTKYIKFQEEKIIETLNFDVLEYRLGLHSSPLNDHQLLHWEAWAGGHERCSHGMLFRFCVS